MVNNTYICSILCNVHACIADNITCSGEDDFRCGSTGACIRRAQLCDGVMHCSDGSDEANCSMFV